MPRSRVGQAGVKEYLPRGCPAGLEMVEIGEVTRVLSVHRTKHEAVSSAKVLARAHKPSQVLVSQENGTVQTEHLRVENPSPSCLVRSNRKEASERGETISSAR